MNRHVSTHLTRTKINGPGMLASKRVLFRRSRQAQVLVHIHALVSRGPRQVEAAALGALDGFRPIVDVSEEFASTWGDFLADARDHLISSCSILEDAPVDVARAGACLEIERPAGETWPEVPAALCDEQLPRVVFLRHVDHEGGGCQAQQGRRRLDCCGRRRAAWMHLRGVH